MKGRVHGGVAVGLVWVAWLVACGGSSEAAPEKEAAAAVTEALSYELPVVDPEAGTITWKAEAEDTVIPLSSVNYLEHREDMPGHFLVEAVLVDGERKVIVAGDKPQMDQAANYGKSMRKDLVERY